MSIVNRKNGELQIDFIGLANVIKKRFFLIILAGVIGGFISYMGTVYLITPMYTASITMYVNNNSNRAQGTGAISQNDLNASAQLVKTYSAIIKSDSVLKKVVEQSGTSISTSAVKREMSISSIDGTEVFKVSITDESPERAAAIANAVAEVVPEKIAAIVQGSMIAVIDYAEVPKAIAKPNYKQNTEKGAMLGILLSLVLVIYLAVIDNLVKKTEELRGFGYPVLGVVPDYRGASKLERKGYGYQAINNNKKITNSEKIEDAILTDSSPFAIKEAYKMLRSNLIFSLPDKGCRTIVVTSAEKGEAKTTTAINLAITEAQNGAKTLLIDCDFRMPTVASKLALRQTPGMTNFLVQDASFKDCFMHTEFGFDCIPAGTIPPNPSELLGTSSMEYTLQKLAEKYDYIIIDSPPIGIVTDANVLSKYVSGCIVVARQGIVTLDTLSSALDTLKFSGTKILGFVFTGVKNEKFGKHYQYYKS